jgi:hypothetical protein
MIRKSIHDYEEWRAPSTHWMGGLWAITNLEAVGYSKILYPCRETNPEQQNLVRRYTVTIPAAKKFKGAVKAHSLDHCQKTFPSRLQMIVWN